jgi:putative ABC transport system permease protein
VKLTARLAYSQLKINRKRTAWTLAGITLSAAMLTAVCGFVASARVAIETALGIDSYSAAVTSGITGLGVLFGAIIVFASVVVVSNAFRVSASERTKQFGILKSVGATKRQIARTILYEGVFLCIVAIPVGLALGLFVEFIGAFIVTDLLNLLSVDGTLSLEISMPFVVTPPMLAAAILTSFGTVLLSAWLPARKAAKITAIDAIRASGEVKIRRSKVKTSKLTQRLFGFEGTLAAKSLKRSRRNFRATVVSLTVSVALLIIAGSFGGMVEKAASLFFPNINATAVGQFSTSVKLIYEDENTLVGKIDAKTVDAAITERITEKLGEYPGADIYGVGSFSHYRVVLPSNSVSETPKVFHNLPKGAYNESNDSQAALSEGYDLQAALLMVDARHYAELCEAAGVPPGSNILVNRRVEREEDGRRRDYAPFNFSKLAGKPITLSFGGEEQPPIVVTGELTGADVPAEVAYMAHADLAIIVPDCDASLYNWFANVPDSAGFTAYAKQIISDMSPKGREDLTVQADCTDIAEQTARMKHMVDVVMFFVYGFVAMLTLIALTNVVSTIGANVRSRSGEFAVLQSVGMTKGGISHMLNLESVLCSVRSLIYGIPLGLIGAYAAYRVIGLAAEIDFSFPWPAVFTCCLGVFAMTWITMRYAASRLRSGSIIDALRGSLEG